MVVKKVSANFAGTATTICLSSSHQACWSWYRGVAEIFSKVPGGETAFCACALRRPSITVLAEAK